MKKTDYKFGILLFSIVVLFGFISYPYQSAKSDDRQPLPFVINEADSEPEQGLPETDDAEQVCENGICKPVPNQSLNGVADNSFGLRGSVLSRVSLSNRRPVFSFFQRLRSRFENRPRLRWIRFE
jgi:hypothetical protein